MFARILLVADMPLGDAGFMARVAEALRAHGHAVQVCPACGDDASLAAQALRMAQEMRASLVVWGARVPVGEQCAAMLEGLACPVKVLGEWECACAPDAAYAVAKASTQGYVPRAGVACVQALGGARREAAERLTGMCGGAVTPAGAADGANAAYLLRTTRCALFFDGDDAPSLFSLAMRVAEGNVVVVERTILAKLPACDFTQSLVAFDMPASSEASTNLTVSPALDTEAACARALERQRAALENLPSLDDELERLLAGLDADRPAGAPAVLCQERRAQTFVVYGWFGARNFGDDMLGRCFIARLSERYPHAVFRIIGVDPARIRANYGCEGYEPRASAELERILRGAAGLAYLGGLVFDEPSSVTAGIAEFMLAPQIEPTFQASLALLAAALQVPVAGVGIGVGPLQDPAGCSAARLMGLAGMQFLPRDANAAELLAAAGVPQAQVRVYADLILGARPFVLEHAAPAPTCLSADGGYFVVSLRDWSLNPAGLEDALAAAVARLAARTGLRAVFLPFDEADVAIHDRVAARARELVREDSVCANVPEDAFEVLHARPGEAQMLAVIAASQFAVGMRLHCSILHHVLGKPALGVDYNDKVHAHFQNMQQEEVLLPLDADAAQACDAVDRFLEGMDERAEVIAQRVQAASEQVDAAYEDFFALVEAHAARAGEQPEGGSTPALVYYPRVVSLTEQRLLEESQRADALAGELAGAREENARLAAEVGALRASHSYRLGNAFMRPLAYLKRLFRR